MNKKQWEEELVKIGWPKDFNFDFDVNRWGSCQYSSALAFYDLYFKMRWDLPTDETLDLLGLKVSFHNLNSFNKEKFMEEVKERYDSDIWGEDYKEIIKRAKKVKNYDEMFTFYKEWSSDLWCAAPEIAGLAFKGLKIKGAPKSKGFGPCLNVEVQSDNISVGLCCALLKDYGLVKNEKSFAGFDT